MSWMYSSASPPLEAWRCVSMPVIGLLGKESETGWQHCRCTKSLQSLPLQRHCFGGERTDMTFAWQTVGVSCGCHSWYIPHVHWRRWHYRQKNLRINSWTPSEPSACLKTCRAFADCRIHGNASESWTEQQWRELVWVLPQRNTRNARNECESDWRGVMEHCWWSTAERALPRYSSWSDGVVMGKVVASASSRPSSTQDGTQFLSWAPADFACSVYAMQGQVISSSSQFGGFEAGDREEKPSLQVSSEFRLCMLT